MKKTSLLCDQQGNVCGAIRIDSATIARNRVKNMVPYLVSRSGKVKARLSLPLDTNINPTRIKYLDTTQVKLSK